MNIGGPRSRLFGRFPTSLRQLQDDLNTKLSRKYESGSFTPFDVHLPGGAVLPFGEGEPEFTLIIKSSEALTALARRDQLGFAQAYISDGVDIEGDFLKALQMRTILDRVAYGVVMGKFVRPIIKGQSRADHHFISQHYDISNDFFLSFLDERHRCYSHALYEADGEQLEDAMTRKMETAMTLARIEPGSRVLDVGAGWGAFTEYASRHGASVTALTLSAQSRNFLYDLAEREALAVNVVLEHLYRYVPSEKFDAIVAMGVSEHLPDYRRTLAVYRRLLKPGGRIYLDAVAVRSKYGLSAFTTKFIYPGNASPVVLHRYLSAVAKSTFALTEAVDDTHSYHLTCRAWAERFEAAGHYIRERWGHQLFRTFQLWLWGSTASLGTGRLQAYHWALELPENRKATSDNLGMLPGFGTSETAASL